MGYYGHTDAESCLSSLNLRIGLSAVYAYSQNKMSPFDDLLRQLNLETCVEWNVHIVYQSRDQLSSFHRDPHSRSNKCNFHTPDLISVVSLDTPQNTSQENP